MITHEEVRQALRDENYYVVVDYIEQHETFTLKVKRYFEIRSNLTTEALLNEYRKLTKEILEELGLLDE
jgi:hypothetical protein